MKDSVETIKKTVAEVQGKKNIRTGMTETVEVTVKPDGKPVSFAPVSYTHLDVYKRQA